MVAAFALGLVDDYQVDRLTAFTRPDEGARTFGYNTQQARIAIGAGGLLGRGLGHGTQTQGGFVPFNHTDFVFSVAGEELGFLGVCVLLGLLAVVLWRGLTIALRARDLFGRLVASGVVLWFGLQAFENVGHEPRDHAGHRCAPAVRVLRRVVDVRRVDRDRPAAQHPRRGDGRGLRRRARAPGRAPLSPRAQNDTCGGA